MHKQHGWVRRSRAEALAAHPLRLPRPSKFLSQAPNGIIFNTGHSDWPERHRAYFIERGLQVPTIEDVLAERSVRRGPR